MRELNMPLKSIAFLEISIVLSHYQFIFQIRMVTSIHGMLQPYGWQIQSATKFMVLFVYFVITALELYSKYLQLLVCISFVTDTGTNKGLQL